LYDNGFTVLTMADLGYDENTNQLYIQVAWSTKRRIVIGVSDVYGDNGEHDNGDMMAVVLDVQQNKSNVLAA
jgi:hypothetical protein